MIHYTTHHPPTPPTHHPHPHHPPPTTQSVTAINLVNQHGSEGRLAEQFTRLSDKFSSSHTNYHLVSFDFHKECGATNYSRLEVLWQALSSDFEVFGYYVSTSKGVKQQQGVFRTNCVDSLDRTNVVQGMLARKQLEMQLSRLDALPPNETLASYYPEVCVRVLSVFVLRVCV